MKNRKTIKRISMVALFSALMVVCSWISIPLGDIKISLQLLAIFLAVSLLPCLDSILSVAVYLALGAVGLPVFAGFLSGAQAFVGPTAGFLIGFLPTALLMALIQKYAHFKGNRIVSYILGTLLCYAFGTAWFFIYAKGATVWHILSIAVLPYIIPDTAKIILAEFIVRKAEIHLKKKAKS